MCIHTKITVISTPGGVPEDLEEYPCASLVEAFDWISTTLAKRDGVVLLRMWFGEQWGGQKTLIRTIGSTDETLRAVSTAFAKAWSSWESRGSSAIQKASTRSRRDTEHAGRSPHTHFRELSAMTVAAGL